MQVEPLSVTVCGLPGALSVNERVPLRLPEELGVKVTLIAQFAPDTRVELHVVVSPKSALAATFAMSSVVVP
jgi:hypothetical protein